MFLMFLCPTYLSFEFSQLSITLALLADLFNGLFLLQAYVFDVEDEFVESDIPTTTIRSKADCPVLEVCIFFK